MKDLNNKFTLASDLIADDVRCKIKNVNSKNETTYITIYNIKGNRRVEILNELKELVKDGEIIDIDMFNLFYTSLILEFTDLVLDTEDLTFMLNEGTLTSRTLLQEINDMVYEIQYDCAMNELANVRNLALTMIAQNSIEEMNNVERRIKNTRFKKTNKKKARRKFIK